MLLSKLAVTVSGLLGVTAAHDLPYCSSTGPGTCNLGWYHNRDTSYMAVILYDRFCVEVGFRGNTGYTHISIPSQLPYTVEFFGTMDGPIFDYAGKRYNGVFRGGLGDNPTCHCYTGRYPWEEACQCAFDCHKNWDDSNPHKKNKQDGDPCTTC